MHLHGVIVKVFVALLPDVFGGIMYNKHNSKCDVSLLVS